MAKDGEKESSQHKKELRSRAEKKISTFHIDPASMTPEEMLKTIHELQVYQIELEMQSDELKSTQVQLEESRMEFIDLYEFAPLGYITLCEKGVIRRANFATTSLLGVDLMMLLNSPLSMHLADQKSLPVFVSFLRRIFKSKTRQRCLLRFKTAGGGMMSIRLDSSPVVQEKQNMKLCTITMSDISHNLVEEELRSLLEEKEMALKEIQHRVKNNFQTLYSLISMQEQQAKNGSTEQEFSAIKSRLLSMSFVHEALYRTEQFSRINLSDYIVSLADGLHKTMIQKPEEVTFNFDVQKDLMIPVDAAIHVGMVINEAVTNSLKHAFPPGFKGACVISISASIEADGRIRLEIGDNGIGFPDEQPHQQTMGLTLISLIAEKQLKGTLVKKTENGTRYELKFDAHDNKKESNRT